MRVKLPIFSLLLLISIPWSSAQVPPTTEATEEPTTATEEPTTEATDPPPPPPPEIKTFDFTEPVHEMHGSYLVVSRDHNEGRPGWASIWPIGNDEMNFGVFFWPPKYCHAVYICPVKHKTYVGKERFDEFSCDDMYVKFYPHIQKIHFKKDKAAAEQEAYNVEPNLQFKREGDKTSKRFSLNALNKNPIDHDDWENMKKEKKDFTLLEWDLTDKDLLILTNSRMCEVNKPGTKFAPIFDATLKEQEISGVTDKWPNWFMKKVLGTEHLPTASLPQVGNSKKTVDLLAHLKTLTPAGNPQLGQITQVCTNFERVGVSGARKPVFEHSMHVSTATFNVQKPNMQPGAPWTFKFEFSISNCQWIRFWASDKPMENYKTDMKIEDTLDVFFQDGFMIPPDTDTPIELPDLEVIDKIMFTIYRETDPAAKQLQPDDNELIEFAFGSANDVYLFRQFFISRAFGKANTNIHMIRSPRCESNLIIDGGVFDQQQAEIINMKDVKLCSYSYLIDDEEVKRINALMKSN